MADGRRREEWEHTSALLALTYNASRSDPNKQRAMTPADFNPYTAKKSRSDSKGYAGRMSIRDLRGAIMGNRNRRPVIAKAPKQQCPNSP